MGVVGSAADPMVEQLKSSLQDDRFSAKLSDVLKLQKQAPQVGGSWNQRSAYFSIRYMWGVSCSCQVSPTATVLDAAAVMTTCRQAVSVVEAGCVVGIFTPKDMLMRVVARGVGVDTLITEVMTPNPDCVQDSSTVLESLHTMHGELRIVADLSCPFRKFLIFCCWPLFCAALCGDRASLLAPACG